MGEDLGGITYEDENALYTGASFPERADGKEPETEVLLIEKDGEELEEQGNQTVQELEALAIAQRIQKLVGIEEVLDKDSGTYRKAGYGDIVILLRTSAGWRSIQARYLHQRESRSIQHLEQDILQRRKW